MTRYCYASSYALAAAMIFGGAGNAAAQSTGSSSSTAAVPAGEVPSASPALDHSNATDRTSPVAQSETADIVVTAQKRVENVQNVPKAVEVVSQARLTQAGVTNLQDLGRVSPSIQGATATPFGVPPIRGIASFALSIGVQTQTGVVLDDIPQPSFSTLANELTDVERIEVLPGPQSTLSGRNAAGGLINIVTHNPTKDFTGTVNFEQTNDHQTRTGGFISGPITGTLGFSVSGFYDKWDGPIRNVAENNLPIGGFNQRGGRVKLQWRPTGLITATLTAFYTKGDFLQTGLISGSPYIFAAPDAGSVFAPGQSFAQIHPGAYVGPYSTQVSTPGHSVSSNENKGGSLRLDYEAGIGTISSITSYSRGNQPRKDLVLGLPLAGTLVYANTDTDVKYTTQELRIASPSGTSKIQYLVGLIYTDTDNFEPYARAPLFTVNWNRESIVRSIALYGRTTYEVASGTSITGGLRFQHDYQSYDFDFVDGTAPRSTNSSRYSFVAGEVSFQHDFARDFKGYFTYSNAQTGRAYDLEDNADAATPAGLQPIASEKVQNYEAGLKTQWFNRKFTVNVSAFRADYSNYQVQSLQNSSDPNVVPTIRLYAIGQVRSQGVEFDTSVVATHNLRLNFSGTYLDANILSYPGAQCYVQQTAAQGCVNGLQNRRGVLPGTSKFRAIVSANYTLPLPSLPFDGTLGVFYRVQTKLNFDLLGSPAAEQGGYGVLNLTAGIRDRSGRYTAELFVNNVANKHYYNNLTADALSPGLAVAASYDRSSSRYFGGRLGFHF